jgi:hypothetical protein
LFSAPILKLALSGALKAVAMSDDEYEYPESDDDCDEQEDMEVDAWVDGAPKNDLIQFDCQEINKFDGLRAGYSRPSMTSQAVYVWLSVEASLLFGSGSLDVERSSALGINPALPVFLKIEFHTAYVNASAPPVVRVLQAPAPDDMNVKEIDGQVECGLSWLLQVLFE